MFSGINKNFFAKLKKESEIMIDKDRARFSPIFDIVLKSLKDKNIYLDAPNYGEIPIKWEIMDLFSIQPENDAVYLLKCVCDAGYEITLNTNMPNYDYNFVYDTRPIINIRKICAEAPCKNISGIKLYPFILHQIDMLYKLIDIKFFGDWLNVLETTFENDKNIKDMKFEEKKAPTKNAQTIQKLLEKYGRENCYFFVDPENIITTKDILSTHAELKEFLEKYMHTEIIYKKIPINISTRRLEKYSFHLASTNEPVFNVYNLGTYTLFPYEKNNDVSPVVACFISLVNMWISYSIDKPVNRADFERYKKNISSIVISKKKYTGTYIDEIVERKMKLLQVNVSHRNRTCKNLE